MNNKLIVLIKLTSITFLLSITACGDAPAARDCSSDDTLCLTLPDDSLVSALSTEDKKTYCRQYLEKFDSLTKSKSFCVWKITDDWEKGQLTLDKLDQCYAANQDCVNKLMKDIGRYPINDFEGYCANRLEQLSKCTAPVSLLEDCFNQTLNLLYHPELTSCFNPSQIKAHASTKCQSIPQECNVLEND